MVWLGTDAVRRYCRPLTVAVLQDSTAVQELLQDSTAVQELLQDSTAVEVVLLLPKVREFIFFVLK